MFGSGLTRQNENRSLATSCWPFVWPGRIVGTFGTWPESANSHTHTQTHIQGFFFFFFVRRDIRIVIETQRTKFTQASMHTHIRRGTAEQDATLKKLRSPGNIPECPVCKSRTICSFTPSFHRSLHPSMYPGESKTLIHELLVQQTDVSLRHFTGTLEYVVYNNENKEVTHSMAYFNLMFVIVKWILTIPQGK